MSAIIKLADKKKGNLFKNEKVIDCTTSWEQKFYIMPKQREPRNGWGEYKSRNEISIQLLFTFDYLYTMNGKETYNNRKSTRQE